MKTTRLQAILHLSFERQTIAVQGELLIIATVLAILPFRMAEHKQDAAPTAVRQKPAQFYSVSPPGRHIKLNDEAGRRATEAHARRQLFQDPCRTVWQRGTASAAAGHRTEMH